MERYSVRKTDEKVCAEVYPEERRSFLDDYGRDTIKTRRFGHIELVVMQRRPCPHSHETSPSVAVPSVAGFQSFQVLGCMDLFPHTKIRPVASKSPASLSSGFPGRGKGEGSSRSSRPSILPMK